MRNLVAFFALCSMNAWAAPDIREVVIDGKVYVAHLKGAVTYCPATIDPYGEILLAIARASCLDKAFEQDAGNVRKQDIVACYLVVGSDVGLEYRSEQLKLMDVTQKCMAEFERSCANNAVGSFMDKLNELELSGMFSVQDAKEVCKDRFSYTNAR